MLNSNGDIVQFDLIFFFLINEIAPGFEGIAHSFVSDKNSTKYL